MEADESAGDADEAAGDGAPTATQLLQNQDELKYLCASRPATIPISRTIRNVTMGSIISAGCPLRRVYLEMFATMSCVAPRGLYFS